MEHSGASFRMIVRRRYVFFKLKTILWVRFFLSPTSYMRGDFPRNVFVSLLFTLYSGSSCLYSGKMFTRIRENSSDSHHKQTSVAERPENSVKWIYNTLVYNKHIMHLRLKFDCGLLLHDLLFRISMG